MKNRFKGRSLCKRVSAILFAVLMLAGMMAIPASAAESEGRAIGPPAGYVYFNYTCGYKDCGLFWQNDQRYNQYRNSAGDVVTLYAGFGECC